jgi:hypothetical protein
MNAIKFANTVLVATVILLGFMFFHTVFSHSELPTGQGAFIYYYVFPVIIITLMVAALKLRKSYRINLALIIISSSFVFYASELLLCFRYNNPDYKDKVIQSKRIKAAKEYGVTFDNRTILEVISQLRLDGIDAYPVIQPRVKLYHKATFGGIFPLGGISNKLTVGGSNENGKYSIFENDKHGFNNPKGVWDVNTLDIAMVGDSFTLGSGVSPDKNIAASIRGVYKNTLNLGMNGNGPLVMLATIKEYLIQLKPKIVLWFYFEGNDLQDLNKEKQNSLLTGYLENEFQQGLILKQQEIDDLLENHVENALTKHGDVTAGEEVNSGVRKIKSYFFTILKLRNLRQMIGGNYRHDDNGADIELFRRILTDAKNNTAQWGGELYFVYLTEWQRYNKPKLANMHRDKVLSTVINTGIPIIDLHKVFSAYPDQLSLFSFRIGPHYNENGYRLVAETILQTLKAKKLE